MYSDKGVLPTHLNLFRPQAWGAFTLFNAFSTAPELWALWGILLVTFLCVLVGYKTRIAHVLAAIFVASMNGRILLIENGGYVVFNLLVMWTAFLPMGDRFSVDALLDSMRRRKEANADELNDRADVIEPRRLAPHVSLVAGVILLQIAAIYYFNVIHKTGSAWKNGTAVHYVLWVDRMVTPIVAAVRGYVPPLLILGATRFVLIAEAVIPICLASPLARSWARRLAVALMCVLHIGFGATFVLGPFAWAMCVFSTLLFTTDDWDIAARTMRRTHRARVVLFESTSGASLWLCRVLKRLDRYELLTFRAQEGLDHGVAVERPNGGTRKERSAALADIVAALPLGPTIAWLFRLPGLSHLVDAIWNVITARDVSRFFGLRVPSAPVPVITNEPSPLRRKLGRVVVTLRELAVVAMLAGAVNQACVELLGRQPPREGAAARAAAGPRAQDAVPAGLVHVLAEPRHGRRHDRRRRERPSTADRSTRSPASRRTST